MTDDRGLTVAEGEVMWAEHRREDDVIDARVRFDVGDVPDDQRDWVRELVENGTVTFSVTVQEGGDGE